MLLVEPGVVVDNVVVVEVEPEVVVVFSVVVELPIVDGGVVERGGVPLVVVVSLHPYILTETIVFSCSEPGTLVTSTVTVFKTTGGR